MSTSAKPQGRFVRLGLFVPKGGLLSVTVYGKEHCVQCNATTRWLESRGVEYEYIDIEKDPEAYEYVTGLGYLQAPVVKSDDATWSGFDPGRLSALA